MDERDDLGRKDERPPEQRGSGPEGLDRDILVNRIIGFAGGVSVLVVVCAAVTWLLFAMFRDAMRRGDPPPPLLPEARERVLPPEPRLQRSPALDMSAYRAREQAYLSSYGWADERASTARIPIERAMELYVERQMRAALVEPPPGEAPADGGAP